MTAAPPSLPAALYPGFRFFFFQSVPGTIPIRDNVNPATWMLEVIGAGTTGQVKGVDLLNHKLSAAVGLVGMVCAPASLKATQA